MAALAFGVTQMAHSATVWNINIGNTGAAAAIIGTGDNFIGAATENTLNSTWNNLNVPHNSTQNFTSTNLVISTGAASTLDFNITTAATQFNTGDNVLAVGSAKIFRSWVKADGNTLPITVTFSDLPTVGVGQSYSLVIYSDWFFGTASGVSNMPITQTVGTGLTGTFNFNRTIDTANDQVGALAQDSDPANVAATANFARLDGLTPSAGNELAFSMTPLNGPMNGFQLILVPEPSAALLGGLGFLALLRRRR